MLSKGIFGGTFGIIEKAMDLRSIKHNLIVSNIANADTPNFKAFDMIVEEELGKEYGSPKGVSLTVSNQNHIKGNNESHYSASSEIHESSGNTRRGDGNTVEIDKEMTKLMENNLIYNSLAHVISKKFTGLKTVIQSNRS